MRYEDFRAIVGIDRLELREGSLPPRVLGLVVEWAELHQAELRENWTTLWRLRVSLSILRRWFEENGHDLGD